MSVTLKAITINTLRMQDLVSFFKILGVALLPSPVNKGSVSYRGFAGEVEICLLSIAKREKVTTPNLSLRIKVQNIVDVLAQLQKIPDVQVVMEPQQTQDGLMAVVIDPDGHSIEICD